jgi:tight adherence protein C
MELVLSSLLMFAATVLLVLAAASALTPRMARQRLARLQALPIDPITRGRRRAGTSLFDDRKSWMVRALAPLAGGASRTGSDGLAPLRERLIRASYRGPNALVSYLGGRVALALVLPALLWFSPLRLGLDPRYELLLPLLGLALGYVGPSYWVDRRIRKRQEEIDRHLPTALDLLVVCVEAGMGLVHSLARVGEELRPTSPVLSEELALVGFESRTGKSNSAALRGLSKRTGVREVSVLVAMLTQTERFGTSLADALRVHCDSMRVKRMQRAEEQAAKAPLKMLFPTSLILFALVGLIIGLAAIRAIDAFG